MNINRISFTSAPGNKKQDRTHLLAQSCIVGGISGAISTGCSLLGKEKFSYKKALVHGLDVGAATALFLFLITSIINGIKINIDLFKQKTSNK